MNEGALWYRKPPTVAVVEIDGRAGVPGPVYLSKLPSGKILVLDGTASVIWRVLGETPADEVVGRVAAELGLDEELIRRDVEGFIGELGARGLVETRQS